LSRLPLVDPEAAPPAVREALAALPEGLAIFRLLAHAETAFRPLLRLGAAILGQLELDPLLRELVILQTSRLTPGEYEWAQHVPLARSVGATPEQIEALGRGELEAGCFDVRQRVALRFGRDALEGARVSDPLFAEMRLHFSPREIVELLIALGYYSMLARLTEVTRTEPDAPAGEQLLPGGPAARSGGTGG
jgi:alkylhydroperoxidase family enzyme